MKTEVSPAVVVVVLVLVAAILIALYFLVVQPPKPAEEAGAAVPVAVGRPPAASQPPPGKPAGAERGQEKPSAAPERPHTPVDVVNDKRELKKAARAQTPPGQTTGKNRIERPSGKQ